MKIPVRFIVIDDDQINNLYCRIIIKQAAGELEIKTFDIPEKGFEYITKEYSNNKNPTVLFLDINMPTWSGWDFLDNFEKLDENIKKQIKIYILSSSVDPADHQQAMDNKYVVGYIEKPLSELTVLAILEEQEEIV
ncbi:MAG: response regulator [Ginsengibacter sp.]